MSLVIDCLESVRLVNVQGSLDARTTRHDFVAARLAEIETILEGVPETNVIYIDALSARIANLEPRLANLADRINDLTARTADLEARDIRLIEAVANISGRIERLNTRCDAEGGAPITGTPGTGSNTITLSFLHSDHLGRPKFATRTDGSVSWDGGITTPFGIQITALAAQTQALMFPGQYMDAETTGAGVSLSHNWHRTYDPTLGRYLQADPIGLAGGLNRYAYVGGNPVMLVDPTGEILPAIVVGILVRKFLTSAAFSTAVEIGLQANALRKNGCSITISNFDIKRILISGGAGGFGGVLKGPSVLKVIGENARHRRIHKAVYGHAQNSRRLVSDATGVVFEGLVGLGISTAVKSQLEPFQPDCGCDK